MRVRQVIWRRFVEKIIKPYFWTSMITLISIAAAAPLTVGVAGWSSYAPESVRRAVSHAPDVLWREWTARSLPLPLVQAGGTGQSGALARPLLHMTVRELTGIDWQEPRSIFAAEMPWLQETRDQLLWGQAPPEAAPEETEPLHDLTLNDFREAIPLKPMESIKPVQPETAMPARPSKSDAQNSRSVLIYHTHNRESWLPELPGVREPDRAYDRDVNVTLLGRRLQKKLSVPGVQVMHLHPDYPAEMPAFHYPKSYRYSAETVQEAKAAHPDLFYYFDIHRDSQKRSRTTLNYKGKSYAQIYLIIGKKNPDWKKNMAFARQIHEALEQLLPGISRGVWGKGSHGNGEYNQSVSPGSVLIEIGGVENDLTESYRSVDVLAQALIRVIGKQDVAGAEEGMP